MLPYGTHAKGMQFYFPSRTYPAIPYSTIFPFLAHCECDIEFLEQSARCNQLQHFLVQYNVWMNDITFSAIHIFRVFSFTITFMILKYKKF